MELNVITNAKRNIVFGAFNRIILMICPFIERTAIQYILGAQYLGLSSLFTSILSVLSLTELGFGSAIIYHMYRPVADGDIGKVNALLNHYRKAYRIIGICIFGIGLLLIPVLPFLIKDGYPVDINLMDLYLIYLCNTVVSYFLFAYLSSILVVYQRDDVQSTINSVAKIGLTLIQIMVLAATHSYYLFALMMVVFTIINNLWIACRVYSLFPRFRPEGNLVESEKSGIRKVVAGAFIVQACGVTRNSIDSICVSAFAGLSLTAIYNNYLSIILGLTSAVSIISASFAGGIGNHVATRSAEENFNELKKLDFLYLWISGWCTTCLLCLFQPFMRLWMGEKMMLPMGMVVLLCLYFYQLKLGDIRSLYFSAKGIWWEHRYRAAVETLLNLVLNVGLGMLFGLYGIIISTMISLFLCNYIWGSTITFRQYFSKGNLKGYFTYQFKQSAVMACICVLTYVICMTIYFESNALMMLVRLGICIVVPNIVLYVIYREEDDFLYVVGIIRRFKR